MIDTIFNAYLNVIPYQFFVIVCGANLIIQFIYEIVSHYDTI
jgi:hypothetical protein